MPVRYLMVMFRYIITFLDIYLAAIQMKREGQASVGFWQITFKISFANKLCNSCLTSVMVCT